MGDAPTVRDELAEVILERREFAAGTTRWGRAVAQADAVLGWLGGLDPDCDPALLAHHLHTSRAEIARLRSQRDELRAALHRIIDAADHTVQLGDMADAIDDARRLLSGDTEEDSP